MKQFSGTMPEAKFRSTKKRVKPASSIRTSEFAHEVRAVKTISKAKPQANPEAVKTEDKKGSQKGFSIVSFWPVAVGIFLSGFAAEWHDMAAQIGVWGMRLTFPLSLIAQHKELLGLDAQMADVLPSIALYGQLPLDGILLMLTLARTGSLKAAVAQVTLVHLVCAFVLWLITV